ncbi:MAG: hypothetical protein PVG24_11485 [Gammaproteobacteria bacterium]|jgi:hypothetical protein
MFVTPAEFSPSGLDYTRIEKFGESPTLWYQYGMIVQTNRYYFWFYGFPMQQAEEGVRSS